jgi:hypothetical protein
MLIICKVNKSFLFSASSPSSYGDDSQARRGLALGHAYSVIKAVEEEDEDGKKHRLVLIRYVISLLRISGPKGTF